MYASLNDLDERLQRVRNQTSRQYAEEAIRAYKGGAYRSAIVSTWIAVVYDLLSKIRELALDGDNDARVYITTLDAAIENHAIQKVQKIENELVDDAASRFQLLSPHEATDMRRLQQDRHLCAHPAFIREEQLFSPEPELPRVHIVHAISHVLSQSPVQGKVAIGRLIADVRGIAFPETAAAVERYVYSKYLERRKDSLLRNLIQVLTAEVFDEATTLIVRRKLLLTLGAISRRDPGSYEAALRDALGKYAGATMEHLAALLELVASDPRVWGLLNEAQQLAYSALLQRIAERRAAPPVEVISALGAASGIPIFLENSVQIFDALDLEQKAAMLHAASNKGLFVNSCFELYRTAQSYRSAEAIGNLCILPLAPWLTEDQIARLLEIVTDNQQIYNAGGTDRVLQAVFLQNQRGPWAQFAEWAQAHPYFGGGFPGLRDLLLRGPA
jgi:hypothetical protein